MNTIKDFNHRRFWRQVLIIMFIIDISVKQYKFYTNTPIIQQLFIYDLMSILFECLLLLFIALYKISGE